MYILLELIVRLSMYVRRRAGRRTNWSTCCNMPKFQHVPTFQGRSDCATYLRLHWYSASVPAILNIYTILYDILYDIVWYTIPEGLTGYDGRGTSAHMYTSISASSNIFIQP